MADMYQKVSEKYKNSPAVVFLFIASFVMLSIGIWLFAEDTVSSKLGLEQLQGTLGMNVQIFDGTYWVMSLAPQIASIVFFYIYLSNTEDKKFLWMSIICQIADFYADAWYRSNGNLFVNWKVFIASSIMTFSYFSIGSEVFITVGFGLVLRLFAPALSIFKIALGDIKKAYKGQHVQTRNDRDYTRTAEPTYHNLNVQQSKPKQNHRPGNFPGPNDFLGGS